MWSAWKIQKYLTFKSGSSQNRRFSEGSGGQEPPVQNRRVGTYDEKEDFSFYVA